MHLRDRSPSKTFCGQAADVHIGKDNAMSIKNLSVNNKYLPSLITVHAKGYANAFV
jgi:hypothetical protein